MSAKPSSRAGVRQLDEARVVGTPWRRRVVPGRPEARQLRVVAAACHPFAQLVDRHAVLLAVEADRGGAVAGLEARGQARQLGTLGGGGRRRRAHVQPQQLERARIGRVDVHARDVLGGLHRRAEAREIRLAGARGDGLRVRRDVGGLYPVGLLGLAGERAEFGVDACDEFARGLGGRDPERRDQSGAQQRHASRTPLHGLSPR